MLMGLMTLERLDDLVAFSITDMTENPSSKYMLLKPKPEDTLDWDLWAGSTPAKRHDPVQSTSKRLVVPWK